MNRLDFRDREVEVHRAGAIGERHVPTFLIIGHVEMPDDLSVAGAQAVFNHDALAIVDVLWHSLPGGTLDRVLALFMKRKVSNLIVGDQP